VRWVVMRVCEVGGGVVVIGYCVRGVGACVVLLAGRAADSGGVMRVVGYCVGGVGAVVVMGVCEVGGRQFER
jgi:hypothetical protein